MANVDYKRSVKVELNFEEVTIILESLQLMQENDSTLETQAVANLTDVFGDCYNFMS